MSLIVNRGITNKPSVGTPWFRRIPVPLVKPTAPLVDAVERMWRVRACFVCGTRGACAHREFEVEVAYLEAMHGAYVPKEAA